MCTLKIPFSLKWTNTTRNMQQTETVFSAAGSNGREADYWKQTTNKPCWCACCCFGWSEHPRWTSLWIKQHHDVPDIIVEGLHFVYGFEWKLYVHIYRLYILPPRRQTLWLPIIWVISLYFYAADVSPCQQAPWQSEMENPPLSECCTWVSLLPFPSLCPHRLPGIPRDAVPCPVLMVGKQILIDACVLNPNQKGCWSDTAEQSAVIYCIFLRSAWWFIYPLRWTRILEPLLRGRLKTLMEGD